MPDSSHPVLVGDAEPSRVAILRNILEHEFNREIIWVETYDSLKAEVEETEKSGRFFTLILVAHGLPLFKAGKEKKNRPVVVPANISELGYGIKFGCIYSAENRPNWGHVNDLFYLRVPIVNNPTDPERNRVIFTLEDGGGLERARPAPEIHLPDDPSLREQIRNLNNARDLEAGRKCLSYLVRNLEIHNSGTIGIEKLVQGKSGATVFRVMPITASDPNQSLDGILVLKLNTKSDRWKLNLEVTKHKEVQNTLGVPGYQSHVAKLRELDGNCVAEYGNWCAICYDFLGDGPFGPFLDLETAVTASPEQLRAKTGGLGNFNFDLNDARQVRLLRARLFNTMLEKHRPRSLCFTRNATLCLNLVRRLRQQAKRVQAQDCGEESMPAFHDEYLPALLFHTVRAVGYDSLSIFKRLLAIHSTSAILDRLKFEPAD